MNEQEQEQHAIQLLNHAGYSVEHEGDGWTVIHSARRLEVLRTSSADTLVLFAEDIDNYMLPEELSNKP